MEQLPPAAPRGKAANGSQKTARMGLQGFAFSLLVWILVTFCRWLATSSKHEISLVFACARN